ncbi:hypothetical protein AGLY_012774, partial [Aphis glycines]
MSSTRLPGSWAISLVEHIRALTTMSTGIISVTILESPKVYIPTVGRNTNIGRSCASLRITSSAKDLLVIFLAKFSNSLVPETFMFIATRICSSKRTVAAPWKIMFTSLINVFRLLTLNPKPGKLQTLPIKPVPPVINTTASRKNSCIGLPISDASTSRGSLKLRSPKSSRGSKYNGNSTPVPAPTIIPVGPYTLSIQPLTGSRTLPIKPVPPVKNTTASRKNSCTGLPISDSFTSRGSSKLRSPKSSRGSKRQGCTILLFLNVLT